MVSTRSPRTYFNSKCAAILLYVCKNIRCFSFLFRTVTQNGKSTFCASNNNKTRQDKKMAQRRAAAAAANNSDSDYVGSDPEYNTDDLYDVADDVEDEEEERDLVLAESLALTFVEGREGRMVVYDEQLNKLLQEAVDVERNKIVGSSTTRQM